MPAPAILGIPLLASLIGSVIAGLMQFFAKYFSKKIAVILAAITAVVAVTGVFVVTIEGMFAAIEYAAPPELSNVFLMVPSNFSACVGTIIGAKIIRWAYEWNVKIIQWKLF